MVPYLSESDKHLRCGVPFWFSPWKNLLFFQVRYCQAGSAPIYTGRSCGALFLLHHHQKSLLNHPETLSAPHTDWYSSWSRLVFSFWNGTRKTDLFYLCPKSLSLYQRLVRHLLLSLPVIQFQSKQLIDQIIDSANPLQILIYRSTFYSFLFYFEDRF